MKYKVTRKFYGGEQKEANADMEAQKTVQLVGPAENAYRAEICSRQRWRDDA